MGVVISNVSISATSLAIGESGTITFTVKNTNAWTAKTIEAILIRSPAHSSSESVSVVPQTSVSIAKNASKTYTRTFTVTSAIQGAFDYFDERAFIAHLYVSIDDGTGFGGSFDGGSVSTGTYLIDMRYAPSIPIFTVSRSPNADSTDAAVDIACTLAEGADSEYEDLALTLKWKEEDAASFPAGNTLAVTIADALASGGTTVTPTFTFETGKAYTLRVTFTDGIDSAVSETKLSKAFKVLNVHPTSKNIGLGQFAVADLDADDVMRMDMVYRPYFHEGARDADGREIIGKADYSTTAVDTGIKWIDGKPIYRQVYRIPPTTANGQTKNVSLGHPFSYYGTIVRVYGITTGNAQIKPLPHVDTSTYYILMDLQSMTSGDPYFRIICASAASMPGGGYAIVEYTIPSRNLAYNNGFLLGSDGWTLHANSVVDTGKTLFGCSSVKVTESGNAADVWRGMLTLSTSRIPSVAGDVWMGSAYVFVQDYTTFAGSAVAVEVSYYNAAGTCLVSRAGVLFPTSAHNGKWTRIAVTDTTPAPANTASVGIFMYVRRNGTCWFACPQLEKDTVVTDWVP